MKEYVEHYNTERPHQNLDNELISPEENIFKEYLDSTKSGDSLESLYKSGEDEEQFKRSANERCDSNDPEQSEWARRFANAKASQIVKNERLGGLLNFYYRKSG